MLDENHRTLTTKCRKQMADTDFNRNYESASESTEAGVKSTVIGSFATNLVMAGSLSQILGMINSLQLIVHLPLFAVSVPANVMTIEGILIPIVMFDIFEGDDLIKVADFVLRTNFAENANQEEEVNSIPD